MCGVLPYAKALGAGKVASFQALDNPKSCNKVKNPKKHIESRKKRRKIKEGKRNKDEEKSY